MRQIGTLPQRSDAIRIASYLVTQGIGAQAEESEGQWCIWVRDEDQLLKARQILAEFREDPGNARYQNVERVADMKLREEISKRESARQNVVNMSRRWGSGQAGQRRPLTIAVVLMCTILGVATNMGQPDPNDTVQRALKFFDSRRMTQGWRGLTLDEKLVDIRQGQWWRAITPAFLHGGVWHLAMNMVMFYRFAAPIENRRKTWRLGLLILVIAAVSNLAQALVPNAWGGSANFVGLSGVVFGLFGYTWMKSRYQPSAGLFVDRFNVGVLLVFLVLGFVGMWDIGSVRIANWAHGVGFLTGVVVGIAPVLWTRAAKT